MNTNDLIRAMAADTAQDRGAETMLPLAVLAAGVGVGSIFLATMGVRADLLAALADAQVLFKQAFPVMLALGALALALQLARPGARTRVPLALLAAVAAALVIAVAIEARRVPVAAWGSAVVGNSLATCVISITLMSLPVLAAGLWAIRCGACTRPTASGAAVGLLAGAVAASSYAFYCIEDSPMFYAVWYLVGMSSATALGALLGPRVLRW